jgi:hypothetical protein
MKKIILILLLSLSILKAQDADPNQLKFLLGNDSTFLNADLDYFKQKKFLLSWEWGVGGKISRALLAQGVDASFDINPADANDSSDLIVKNWGPIYAHHPGGSAMMNIRGFYYDPTLELDPDHPDKLVKRANDVTHPVFGFLNRKGYSPSDSSNENFHRRIFDTSVHNIKDSIILSDPWPDDQLIYSADTNLSDANNYMGLSWYFSINLRRFDNVMNGDTILKIELPYKLTNPVINRQIRFDSIPDTNLNGIDSLPNNRGLIRKLVLVDPQTIDTILYITRNMIPASNSYHKDITISAYFKCDPSRGFNNYLNWKDSTYPNPIQHLGIKITYLDTTCPIAIRYAKFETPHTMDVMRGFADDFIADTFQSDLNLIHNDTAFSNHAKRFFRYKLGTDYYDMQYYIGIRYFNKLVGNISVTEGFLPYPEHFEYYTNTAEQWLGMYGIAAHVSAPYSRNSWISQIKSFGITNGYTGYRSNAINDSITTAESDYTKSHYETFLVGRYDKENGTKIFPITFFLNGTHNSDYPQMMNTWNNGYKASYLTSWEGYIYNKYMKNESRGFLFSDRFWWPQYYIHHSLADIITTNPSGTYLVMTGRANTGEELRLDCFLPIILGAKGLIYDGNHTDNDLAKSQFYDGNQINPTTRATLESLGDSAFLNSDIGGSDFIRPGGEILNFNSRMICLDTIGKYQTRPYNKIYYGRKSCRLEMRKVHEWIRATENTLMQLRLQCWWAKGYREWYQQHPKYTESDTLINKFVDLRGIRTKHPFADRYEGDSIYNYRDSSFYDITLLSTTSSSTYDQLNSQYYIGVQNRRTSPLVQPFDVLSCSLIYSI